MSLVQPALQPARFVENRGKTRCEMHLGPAIKHNQDLG